MNPENYRGITLLSTTTKLFTSLLKGRLEDLIENREEQQGFRKNRSTTDAIFIIQQIKEKAIEFDKVKYACFVDLTKAFDKVQLKDVVRILDDEQIPQGIVRIIEQLNTNNTTKIRTGNETSEEIPTPGGIRQGDSLSPFLFNKLMDKIIEKVTELKLGYRLGKKTISIICYADDATIVAETEDDLQRLLLAFCKSARELNMTISSEKTKSMTFAKEPVRCKLVIQDKPIEQVMQFKYLGVDISTNQNQVNDITSQINKAAAISGCLRDVIWTNKYMKIESKTRIYKTCVRPILTYGIEARADTSRTKSKLRTAEMKTLRTIAGKTLWGRVRNEDVR